MVKGRPLYKVRLHLFDGKGGLSPYECTNPVFHLLRVGVRAVEAKVKQVLQLLADLVHIVCTRLFMRANEKLLVQSTTNKRRVSLLISSMGQLPKEAVDDPGIVGRSLSRAVCEMEPQECRRENVEPRQTLGKHLKQDPLSDVRGDIPGTDLRHHLSDLRHCLTEDPFEERKCGYPR